MNTWKKENMKSADDPFTKHLPDNPFRADAWLSCLRWSVTELERLATFRTNNQYMKTCEEGNNPCFASSFAREAYRTKL